VRLDHLLSKEHLDPQRGPGARGPRMSDRGARRRRHWRVTTGNGSQREYDLGGASASAGRESLLWMRLVMAISTLLGPEGTTESAMPAPPSDRGWVVVSARQDCGNIPVIQFVGGVRCFRMRFWVGRWLRIAQWTRASCFLWLSCLGRTVDALASGADEGRGRPR
jgi:hypothetical protein